jgi:hypothetical protein
MRPQPSLFKLARTPSSCTRQSRVSGECSGGAIDLKGCAASHERGAGFEQREEGVSGNKHARGGFNRRRAGWIRRRLVDGHGATGSPGPKISRMTSVPRRSSSRPSRPLAMVNRKSDASPSVKSGSPLSKCRTTATPVRCWRSSGASLAKMGLFLSSSSIEPGGAGTALCPRAYDSRHTARSGWTYGGANGGNGMADREKTATAGNPGHRGRRAQGSPDRRRRKKNGPMALASW